MPNGSARSSQCFSIGLLLAVLQISAYRPSQDDRSETLAKGGTSQVSINQHATIALRDPEIAGSQSAGIQEACDVSGKTDPKEVLQQLRVCTGTLQNIAKKTKEGEVQSRQANEQYVKQFKGIMDLLGKLQDVNKVKEAFTKDQHTAMDFLLGETGKIDDDISTFDQASVSRQLDEAPRTGSVNTPLEATPTVGPQTANVIQPLEIPTVGPQTANVNTPLGERPTVDPHDDEQELLKEHKPDMIEPLEQHVVELQKLAQKAQSVFLELQSRQSEIGS